MKLNDIQPGILYAFKQGGTPRPVVAVATRKRLTYTSWDRSGTNGTVVDGMEVLVLAWGTYPLDGERATVEEAAATPLPTNVNQADPPQGWRWQTVQPQYILRSWADHEAAEAERTRREKNLRDLKAAQANLLVASQAALLERLAQTDLVYSGNSWETRSIRVLADGQVHMSHDQLRLLLDMAGIK